jgi:3-oxoadipate enol-lactonase
MVASLPAIDFTTRGSGHPVVLLHPLGADTRYWDFLDLPGRRLMAYNLPGHGGAAPAPAGYSIADLGDHLAEALASLDQGPVSLVGVSIGGLVAQRVAARHPELVDRIVLADTVAVYPDGMRTNLGARGQLVLTDGLTAVLDGTYAMWYTQDLIDRNDPLIELTRSMILAGSPQGYSDACRALVEVDFTGEASAITAPTLVVCGRDDLPAFQEGCAWLADVIPGARLLWLEGGRHGAVLECSAQFAAAINDFLPVSRG